MIEIPLTQGKVALIDDEDAEIVLAHRWYAWSCKPHLWYARTNVRFGEPRHAIEPPAGLMVDHRDGDGVNNRRSNLRVATPAENARNISVHRPSTSPWKGVSWCAPVNRWRARIRTLEHGSMLIGYFDRQEDAARAYDAMALELHGEFARVNFPSEVNAG